MWATLAALLLSIVVRIFYYNRTTSLVHAMFNTSHVLIKQFPDNMIELDMAAPESFTWQPSQHAYVRIPAVSIFDNHPFTIANVCDDSLPTDDRHLRFLIRPYAGFTHRLHSYIKSHPEAELGACIEGPYGTYHADILTRYDTLILIAGGGGITAILPWIEEFASNKRRAVPQRTSQVRVYWSIRHVESLCWIDAALKSLDIQCLQGAVQFTVHITGSNNTDLDPLCHQAKGKSVMRDHIDLLDVKTSESSQSSSFIISSDDIKHGRMTFPTLFASLPTASRTMVIGMSVSSSHLLLARQ